MRAPSGLCVTTGADDHRLIEDYLPLDVLNAIASKEKLHPRRAGRVSVSVKATSDASFDKARIENGVLEPFRELGLLDDQQS